MVIIVIIMGLEEAFGKGHGKRCLVFFWNPVILKSAPSVSGEDGMEEKNRGWAELPLLEVEALSFTYPRTDVPVLRGVYLTIRRGEWVALAGATGAGKSTLCLALTGLIPGLVRGRLEGTVRVAGKLTTEHRPTELACDIGLVFQDYTTQLFASSVALEIAFPLENLAVPTEEIQGRLEETLAALDLTALRDRSPRSLSGGQQQRVAIASVLGLQPRILVLDEAFTDLDPHTRRLLLQQLHQLRAAKGLALLTVERETEQLLDADRLILMQGGQVVAQGLPAEVLADDAVCTQAGVQSDPLANILEAAGLEPAVVSPEETAERLRRAGYFRDTGAWTVHLRENDAQRITGYGEVLATVQGVSYFYPESHEAALQGVNLALRRGEWVVLVGPNGSGKSTLGKLLAGLIAPTQGTVQVRGKETARTGPAVMTQEVGLVFQDPDHQIFCEQVGEEVAFALRRRGLSAEEVERNVDSALAAVGLSKYRMADPFSLPRGLRQLTAVASALALNPSLLILDEPVTGLDAGDVRRLMEVLQGLNAAGHTLLLITHSMPLAAAWAHRIIVLGAGKVVLDGTAREVFADPERVTALGLEVPRVVALGQALGIPFRSAAEVISALRGGSGKGSSDARATPCGTVMPDSELPDPEGHQ